MRKNNKTSKSKEYDSERETRTLLENVCSDIKKIAETQSSTVVKVSEIEKAVADLPVLKSEMKSMSMAIMQISNDVKSVNVKLDENLSNHEKRITKLEEKVLA